MNKTALKNLAMGARKDLIKKVEAKALKIGITEESIKKADFEGSDAIYIDGKQLSITEKNQRDKLIQRIREIGFVHVIEEVAYTWFNRFTALRFMEVNNYLPTKVRVLSSGNSDNPEPDIMKEALTVGLDIDKEFVYELKINNQSEELYKYLIIKQCNSLNKYLPFMFETIDDYKEILFPEGLLAKDTFLRRMTDTEVIAESDWKQVEIIGWLYQYYISEAKDKVYREKGKHKKEEIPYVTQLFTPDWIVRYMVQNSLGKYWLESHPEHSELINHWAYYIEDLNQEADVQEKLVPFIKKELKVEDIKCFDPAMGSGHILVYLFDVLFEIYSKCGYMEREIPRLIIENNLYGIDIDDRAYELACFAVVMKALEYNKRFFRTIEQEGLALNFVSMKETNNLSSDDIAFIAGSSKGTDYEKAEQFIKQFADAKIYGSLIKKAEADLSFIKNRLIAISESPADDILGEISKIKCMELLPELIKQADILYRQYDVIITNPPYIGSERMNVQLSNYLKTYYPASKMDTCTAFMELIGNTKQSGYLAMINQHSWMFLSSFDKLREQIINNYYIESMLHLGPKTFEEIGGEVVQSTSFIMKNAVNQHFKGTYIRLVDYKDSKEKAKKALEAINATSIDDKYYAKMNDYVTIPGNPISYWLSISKTAVFQNKPLSEYGNTGKGIGTGDNPRFLRLWYEVGSRNFSIYSRENVKWFPYNKGGNYRKWFGNNDHIVNWENNGIDIKNSPNSYIRNSKYFFKPGLTWTKITSSNLSVRKFDEGFIFDDGGCCFFTESEELYDYFLALLNSNVFHLLGEISPTLNYQPGDVGRFPTIIAELPTIHQINELTKSNVTISKQDWDFYETSWDFKKHPLIDYCHLQLVEKAYAGWRVFADKQFGQLKENEEQLNRIFIDLYGLSHEMSPLVTDKEVSVKRADETREVKSFISYAVGCMLGRYSLDHEGLMYAGDKFDHDNYKTFTADQDNIVLNQSDTYFDDDILSRFIGFVKLTFGEETLSENLKYIAGVLGAKDGETAKETIRRYFVNDFYRDHVQTYKKRPIYWQFSSGKHKAFNCLIYMHRYDKTTLSRIRTDYLHEQQTRLDAEKKSLLSIMQGDGRAKEISNAKAELKSLEFKIEELKAYDESLHHLADMQIELDLDDGVAVNYGKLGRLLAKLE